MAVSFILVGETGGPGENLRPDLSQVTDKPLFKNQVIHTKIYVRFDNTKV
jgi:hypothetical protein